MMYAGTALFFAVPLLPFFETTEFTPETLFWSVVIGALLTLPLLFYCVKNVANGTPFLDRPETLKASNKGDRKIWRMVLGNRPFLLFLGAFFFAGTGVGISVGVTFIFVDVYLQLGEKLSFAYLLSIGISILAVGLWYGLANKAGKPIAWGLGMLLAALGDLGMGYVTPGESGWFPLLLCMAFIYVGMTATVTLAPSLLSDIIDYGNWKFGQDYAASYFSLYTLVFKANIGVGTALGLAVAGIYGFDPASAVQSDQAIFGLRLSIAWLPALMTVIAIGFIVLTPINTRRHNILRRALQRKAQQRSRKAQQQSQVLNKQPSGLGQLTVSG
jgi:Na+/melibiose symporter-like transporter